MDLSRPLSALHATRQRPWRFVASWWPLRAVAYLLTSAIVGVLLTPMIVVFFVFLPFWGIAIGALERRRVALVGGETIRDAHVPLGRKDWRIWVGIRLGEPTTWREVGNLFTTVFFGLVSAALLVVMILPLVILPVGMGIEFNRVLPTIHVGDFTWTIVEPFNMLPSVLVVIAALVLLGYLATLLGGAQAIVVRMWLRPRQDELRRQIAHLTVSRVTLVEAFESERKRIERNLHDGVQQQLVSLTMALAMAELDLREAAEAGHPVHRPREAVADAHAQAEQALVDLRDTVRGIHPQSLTKYGLAEAVRELIGRSPLQVEEDISLDQRLPAPLEASIYFIISECMTNTIKHSGATQFEIQLFLSDNSLNLTVQDNGEGGADPAKGSGLRGLQERVRVHHGTFSLDSPTGGPTTIRVTTPAATLPPPPRHRVFSRDRRPTT